ncbi:MAG: hypothetical protein ACXVKM_14895 [Flavisolibacter sp.]
MRKRKSLIISLLIILIILLGLRFTILALRDSEGDKKGPPVQCYSASIEESRKDGVFQFETNVNKHGFAFGNSLKCEIKSAWVENGYSRQPLMFGSSPIQKFNDFYQLMVVIKIDTTNKKYLEYFYFVGNQPLDTLVHYYCKNEQRPDTIKIPIYRSKTDEFSDKKKTNVLDTLIFTKKETSH